MLTRAILVMLWCLAAGKKTSVFGATTLQLRLNDILPVTSIHGSALGAPLMLGSSQKQLSGRNSMACSVQVSIHHDDHGCFCALDMNRGAVIDS